MTKSKNVTPAHDNMVLNPGDTIVMPDGKKFVVIKPERLRESTEVIAKNLGTGKHRTFDALQPIRGELYIVPHGGGDLIDAPATELATMKKGTRFAWSAPTKKSDIYVKISQYTYQFLSVRCKPSGSTKASAIIHQWIHAFVDGDRNVYERLHKDDVDVDDIEVIRTGKKLEAVADVKGFTKPYIMAYVTLQNGPLNRNEILKQVAFIEGKPYVPTSNKSYFDKKSKHPLYGANQGIVGDVLKASFKQGNSIMYTVTKKGAAMAAKVTERIGTEPAERASES